MKQSEFKKCALCYKGVCHGNNPMFFVISIERFMVIPGAVQRQAGLEMFLGSPKLASIMGPDSDLAKKIHEQLKIFICDDCSLKNCVAEIDELVSKEK